MTTTLARVQTAPAFVGDRWPPEAALEATWDLLQQRRFDAMRAAFRRHGGLMPADQICALLREHWDQPLSRLARWIVQREVVSVSWQSQVWLPLFQFERPSLDVMPAAARIVHDLRSIYDDWGLAEWFVAPHDLLAGRAPATDLFHNPCAVFEAARRDRFVNRW